MEYLHTMIRITDIDESLNFFCEYLGLKEVKRIENERGRFTLIFLSCEKDLENARKNNSPLLELTYNWVEKGEKPEALTSGRSFGHIAFRVENIYETCRKLMENGVTINRPPRDGHMAFIKSPDGISIELLQKGDSLVPSEPWKSMPNVGSW